MSSEAPKSEAIPERPKDAPEGEKGPSKKELKKMAKEAEKAERAAKRKAEEEARKAQEAASDFSKDDYGLLPTMTPQPDTPASHKRVKLADIAEKYKDSEQGDDEEPIQFRATVDNARNQSAKLSFLSLRQGSNSIQAVVAASDTLSRQMVKFAGNISWESVVLVHGLVKKPFEPVKSATVSHLEIHVRKIYLISKAQAQLPLQLADIERPVNEEPTGDDSGRPLVGLDTRLTHRVLDLRGKTNHAIFQIRSAVKMLFLEFLVQKHGFISVETPKLLGAPSEGGSNTFEVKYFDRKAYLAQSPQLYKQGLIVAGYERVCEIGPVFRAENSNTARHLTEFTGLDMEMTFEENYHEVMDVLENLMLHIFSGLNKDFSKQTKLVRDHYGTPEFKLPKDGKTPRIPFSEGTKLLREAGEEISDFDDLSTPQEKHLGKLIREKYDTDFYVLDQFPLAVRPFYTMPSSLNPEASNSYDFMMRGQEICSGAQRVHDADLLVERMKAMDPPVDPESPGLKSYVQGFRYGCPWHGGGGFGLERIVMLWLGLPNARLASLFPRDPSRLEP